MVKMDISLDWQGPYSWISTAGMPCIIDQDLTVGGSPGIYLWTIPYGDGFLVYYAGETVRPLRSRLEDEYMRFLDGREYLPDPGLLIKGVKDFLYKPKNSRQANLPDFRDRYDELQPIIDELLCLFHLFVAPVVERAFTKRVEAATLWDIWDAKAPAWNILSNYSWLKRRREIRVPVNFPDGVRVWGLGSTLEF